MADHPWLWIVAGPNGSGKSTVYRDVDYEQDGRSVWIVNPDLLAKRISEAEGLVLHAANVAAVTRISDWLYASVAVHKTIGVETVLSTGKYRALVTAAKAKGYEIRLHYVILSQPELNIQRVRARVEKGGHDVDAGKIVERYYRSLDQLPWFLDQADRAWIYDNSGAGPRLVASKSDGTITLDPSAIPLLKDAVFKLRDVT
jgi:predicted ABC-type ATPase